jgi:hypothetical protein
MSGRPGSPTATLAQHEVALGAKLLSTGHISMPHAAYIQLMERSKSALAEEIKPKLNELGFADLNDMLAAVDELRAQPPAADPMDAYLKRAQALEYTGLDDLFDALEQHGREYDATQGAQMSQPPAPGAPAPTTIPPVDPAAAAAPGVPRPALGDDLVNSRKLDEGTRNRIAKMRDEFRNKTTAAEQAKQAAEQQLEQSKQQIAVMQAEESLKLDLVRSGVSAANFDYAWYAMKQKLAALAKDVTPDGVKKLSEFSAATWAAEQRTAAPYLFGEQVVPATTGATGGAPQPAPMGAGAVTGAAAGAGAFDARTATSADVKKRLGDLGINYNVRSTPPIQR